MLSVATTGRTIVAWLVEWSSFTRRRSPATNSSSTQIGFEYIARKMTDWYKVFPLSTAKAVVDEDGEAEAEEGEVGSVVEAPAVVASGASCAFRMSPRPGEGEGG